MLALVLAASLAQDTKYADDFVLSMSRDKWAAYYDEKEGSSTAAMSHAQITWGEALRRRNDRRLADKAKLKAFVVKIRPAMATFHEEMVTVGSTFSGGGTMWNPVYASGVAEVEEVVSKMISSPKASKGYYVSSVSKELDRLSRLVKTHSKQLDEFRMGEGVTPSAQATASLLNARKSLATLASASKTQARGLSDLTLEFCVRATKIPDESHLGMR